MINTPHINQTAEIAETILLPGDPLRAKFIAETFFENTKQFNKVRGALGYTGTVNGKPISVLGTGMGIPSMGIYSHELINIFGVKNLIRIGSCGSIQENINLYDVIFAMSSSTNSNFASQFNLPGTFSASASWNLLEKAKKAADELNIKNLHIGNVLSADNFYTDDPDSNDKWKKMGTLGIEMESAALYMNAARYNANALCILTVSDNILTGEKTTVEEREKAFTNMIKIALKLA